VSNGNVISSFSSVSPIIMPFLFPIPKYSSISSFVPQSAVPYVPSFLFSLIPSTSIFAFSFVSKIFFTVSIIIVSNINHITILIPL